MQCSKAVFHLFVSNVRAWLEASKASDFFCDNPDEFPQNQPKCIVYLLIHLFTLPRLQFENENEKTKAHQCINRIMRIDNVVNVERRIREIR